MKDINAILAEHDIPDEAKKAIAKEVGENYRTIAETQKKAERIAELEKANAELAEQVKGLEGEGEQVEKLRKQVAEFEEVEKKRKADAEEAAKRESFGKLFDEAVGDREFANALVRDSVFERVYSECQSMGKGAKDVLESLVKDEEGIWRNPQQSPKRMPSGTQGKQTKDDAAAKKEIARFLFGARD